nr:RHS repeat-associated core domain-containing protein [Chryseobacterium sp. MEBOG06]
MVEVNSYYPFGMLHDYTTTKQNAYQYKYNGKELQETGMYDYGARMYMPDLGRWGVVDPLTEKYRRHSPYNYAVNNPILFIDPDGRDIRIGEHVYSYQKNRDYSKIGNDFERNAYKAIDKLYSSGAMKVDINGKKVDMLQTLISDKKNTISIAQQKPEASDYQKNGNNYDPSTKTVNWRDKDGITFRKDVTQPNSGTNQGQNSPTSLLSHELIHGYNDTQDNINYNSRKADKTTANEGLITPNGANLSFSNLEEKHTTGLANQVNDNLGEDKRTNYGKNYYETKSPETTDPK